MPAMLIAMPSQELLAKRDTEVAKLQEEVVSRRLVLNGGGFFFFCA